MRYPPPMPFDPSAAVYRCDYCQQPLRPDALGVARRVTGWVENRKNGGANAVRYPEAPTGYAHIVCLDAAKHPSAAAPSLF